MTEKKPALAATIAINSEQQRGTVAFGAPKAPGASVQPRAPAETGAATPPPKPKP